MEAGYGQSELSAGFEEASKQEEDREGSVQEEFSGEGSDEIGSDTIRSEQIPNDD